MKTKAQGEAFISRHIRKHRAMGMDQKQAVAVALTEAREKEYPGIPPPRAGKIPPGIRKLERRP